MSTSSILGPCFPGKDGLCIHMFAWTGLKGKDPFCGLKKKKKMKGILQTKQVGLPE